MANQREVSRSQLSRAAVAPTAGPEVEAQIQALVQAQHIINEMSRALVQAHHAISEDRLFFIAEARDEVERTEKPITSPKFIVSWPRVRPACNKKPTMTPGEATKCSDLNFRSWQRGSRKKNSVVKNAWEEKRRATACEASAEVARLQQLFANHQLSSDSSSISMTEVLRQARAAAALAADEARSLRGSITKYEPAYSSVSESLVAERAAREISPAPATELVATMAEVERLRYELRGAKAKNEHLAICQVEELRRELSDVKADNEQLVHNLTTTVSELDRLRRSKTTDNESPPSDVDDASGNKQGTRSGTSKDPPPPPLSHRQPRAVGRPLRVGRRSKLTATPSEVLKLAQFRFHRFLKPLNSEHRSSPFGAKYLAHLGALMRGSSGS